jgi:Uma2 family endonuclease
MEISEQQPKITPEQYLALERNAAHKSEYINGHIFAMAGASQQHNQITFNIAVALGIQIKGRTCVAYSNDMRIKVSQTGLYTYPDIVATCHDPQFEDAAVDTLLNPAMIIEVLSDSTEAYDRGAKFAHYRRLPSLQEYILVAQGNICVEHFICQDDRWILFEYTLLCQIIRLNSIQCSISLSDIYDKVKFAEKDSSRFVQ